MDGLVEKVVEQKILKVWVLSVRRGDVFQKHGTDDASSAPHERNGGFVQLPVILFRSLCCCQRVSQLFAEFDLTCCISMKP